MKRIGRTKIGLLVAALAFTGLAGCGGGGDDTRTIRVDYQTDDFAGVFSSYFPRTLTVTPGMTVRFEQTWTGEPHSVTMGKIVDEGYRPIRDDLPKFIFGEVPSDTPPPDDYRADIFEEKLPFLFGETEDGEEIINQLAGLPCYAPTEDDLPLDNVAEPCADEFREQPEFDGSYAYYSSGFIPFEGDLANEFELKIAEDTPDGVYGFYCNLHSVTMSGEIEVKRGAEVESQGDINRRGRDEFNRFTADAREVYEKEVAGDAELPLPLNGSGVQDYAQARIVEFTPRTINTKVGEKVTWTFIGDHTLTFNVPPYTPLFTFADKGFLQLEEELDSAAGGWPGAPDRPFSEEGPPPDPVSVDAGNFDGSGGIKSSGTGWMTGDKYSITFTKAGTYPYACLIHPGQIGKVVVA